MSAKERRRKFDVATKLVLAREAQTTSLNAVSKKYDVARQNLRLWIRTSAQLERRAQEMQRSGSSDTGARSLLYRLPGAGRRVSCAQLDRALSHRVAEQRAHGVVVTRRLLQEWALELKATTRSDVAVGPSWISRFMQRHRISVTASGAIVPTDLRAPDQQRRTRVVVSDEDKLAIMAFFETSSRDIEKTLQQFYGPIADPKVRQVKMRNIYHWLHKRDEIAHRVHTAQLRRHAGSAAATQEDQARRRSRNSESAATDTRSFAARSFRRLLAGTGDEGEEDGGGDATNEQGASHERNDHVVFARPHDFVMHESEPIDHTSHHLQPTSVPPRSSDTTERRMSADSALHLASEGPEVALQRLRASVLARQAALNEQKEQLLVESIRCSNALKRIKVAEESILARKRLRDAGVAQHEIDEQMPLVRFSAGELE